MVDPDVLFGQHKDLLGLDMDTDKAHSDAAHAHHKRRALYCKRVSLVYGLAHSLHKHMDDLSSRLHEMVTPRAVDEYASTFTCKYPLTSAFSSVVKGAALVSLRCLHNRPKSALLWRELLMRSPPREQYRVRLSEAVLRACRYLGNQRVRWDAAAEEWAGSQYEAVARVQQRGARFSGTALRKAQDHSDRRLQQWTTMKKARR